MSRIVTSIRRANERDRQFIMGLDLAFLDKVVIPLFAAFLCLNFLDVYSTLLALRGITDFRELNPIASALFSLQFNGFLLAMAFKYLPVIPLLYIVFVKDPKNRHPFEVRMLRFIALVVLVGADCILMYVVVVNNIPILVGYFAH